MFRKTLIGFFLTSSLDLRADMFDALNHTQWGPASNSDTPGNANYGVILTTARRVTCNSRCLFGFEGQDR